MNDNKIPREKIPWYPSVDISLCLNDKKCFEFCPHGVYTWNEELLQPAVTNPYECIVGCSNCIPVCPSNAISFPSMDEIMDIMMKLREEMEISDIPNCGCSSNK
jgi:NAD-dependent dihydropyrimidine dehydrogenase PreA subunit